VLSREVGVLEGDFVMRYIRGGCLRRELCDVEGVDV
jgi:hypothetical protein